jgi:hypothetical protein
MKVLAFSVLAAALPACSSAGASPPGPVEATALASAAVSPLELAHGSWQPQGLTLSGGEVYWTTAGTKGVVMSATIGTAGGAKLFKPFLKSPNAIGKWCGVTTGNVYFMYGDTRDNIWIEEFSGGTLDGIAFPADTGGITGLLAASAAGVFWVDGRGVETASGGGSYAINSDSSQTTNLVFNAAGTKLFFGDGTPSTIQSLVVSSGLEEELATDTGLINGIAVTPDVIYWINSTTNLVQRVSPGGKAQAVVATVASPVAVAAWGQHVFVATSVSGDGGTDATVLKIEETTGVTKTLARSEDPITDLQADGTNVYFATYDAATGTGHVKQVAW